MQGYVAPDTIVKLSRNSVAVFVFWPMYLLGPHVKCVYVFIYVK